MCSLVKPNFAILTQFFNFLDLSAIEQFIAVHEGIFESKSLLFANHYLTKLFGNPKVTEFCLNCYFPRLKPGFLHFSTCTLSHTIEFVKDVFDVEAVSSLTPLFILQLVARQPDDFNPILRENIVRVFFSYLMSFDNDIAEYISDMISPGACSELIGLDLLMTFEDQLDIEKANVRDLSISVWNDAKNHLGSGQLSLLINSFGVIFFNHHCQLNASFFPVNVFSAFLDTVFHHQHLTISDPMYDFDFNISDDLAPYKALSKSGVIIPLYPKPGAFRCSSRAELRVTMTDYAARLSSISSCVVASLSAPDIFIFHNLLTYYSFFRPRLSLSEQMYSNVKTVEIKDDLLIFNLRTLLTSIELIIGQSSIIVFVSESKLVFYSYSYSNGYVFEVLHSPNYVSTTVRYPIMPLYFPSVREEYIPNKFIGVFSTISELNQCALEVLYELLDFTTFFQTTKLIYRHGLAYIINSKYHGTGHALIPQPLLFMATQNHASSRVLNATGSKFFMHDSLLSNDGKVSHVCRLCGNIGTSQYITRICEFFGSVSYPVLEEFSFLSGALPNRQIYPDVNSNNLNHEFISSFLNINSYKARGVHRPFRVPFEFARYPLTTNGNYFFNTSVVPSSLHPTVEPVLHAFNPTFLDETDVSEVSSLEFHEICQAHCEDNFFTRAIDSNVRSREGSLTSVDYFWERQAYIYEYMTDRSVYLDSVCLDDYIPKYPDEDVISHTFSSSSSFRSHH